MTSQEKDMDAGALPAKSLCKTFQLDVRWGERLLWQKGLPGAMNTGGVEGEHRLRPPVGRDRGWVQSREEDVGRGAAWLRFAA